MRAVARACVAAFLLSTLFVIPAAQASATNPGDFSLIAHRGHAWERGVTENTIRAAQIGIASGATAVEFDVQPTRDDEIVVMHDARLRRTTYCRGLVRKRTLARLMRCEGRVDHERVPSFDAMLAWGASTGVNMVIDIKTDPKGRSKPWTDLLLGKLVSKVEAAGMTHRVRFMSFRTSQLATIEALTGGAATTIVVLDAGTSPLPALQSGSGVDVASMCVEDVTPDVQQLLSDYSVAYMSRVTDNTTVWSMARDLHATSVVVDRPANYRTWEATGTYSGLVEDHPCHAGSTTRSSPTKEGSN